MAFFTLLLSGLVIGGGLTGWWLTRRWKEEARQATRALDEMALQYKADQDETRQLRQQVADLTYQLNEAQKTIRHLEDRQDNS